MMDGRVKTLHPKVHGGLLALRDNDAHVRRRWRNTASAPDRPAGGQPLPLRGDRCGGARVMMRCIENIDIGGPAMIRAAAKNHKLSWPRGRRPVEDYDALLAELSTPTTGHHLCLPPAPGSRSPMPAPAPMIRGGRTWMAGALGKILPRAVAPWQARAEADPALWREPAPEAPRSMSMAPASDRAWPQPSSLQGKELSYNNINDTDAAFELVSRVRRHRTAPPCAIIKHANPCGVAAGRRWRSLPDGHLTATAPRPSAGSSR